MSLSIGTLVGYLELDDKNFNAKAQAADRRMSAMQLHLQALARERPEIAVEVSTQTTALDVLKAKLEELQAQAEDGLDVRLEMVQAQIGIDRVNQKLREMHRLATEPAKVDVNTTAANAELDKTIAKVGLLHRMMGAGGILGGALKFGGGGLLAGILPAAVPLAGAGLGVAGVGALGVAAAARTDKQAKAAAALQKKAAALQLKATEYQQKAGETSVLSSQKNAATAKVYLQKAALLDQQAAQASTAASAKSKRDQAAAYRLKARQVGESSSTVSSQARAADYQKKADDAVAQAKALLAQARGMLSKPQKAFENAKSNLGAAFDKLIADPALLAPITAFFNIAAKDLPLLTPLIHAVSKELVGMLKGIGKHPGEVKKFIGWIIEQLPIAEQLAKEVEPVLGNLFKAFNEAAPTAVKLFGDVMWVLDKLGPAILPIAVGLASLFFGPEFAAGAALVTILIQLWTHSKRLRTEVGKLRDWFEKLGHQIGHNLQPVLAALRDVWKHDLLPAFKKSAPMLEDIAKKAGHFASKVGDIVSKLAGAGGPGLVKLVGALAKYGIPELVFQFKIMFEVLDKTATAIDAIVTGLDKIKIGNKGGKSGTSLLGALFTNPASGIGLLSHLGGLLGGNAVGTNDWRGGLTRLAENGPELVYGPTVANLAPHSKVIPAGRTMSMLKDDRTSQRGAGGMTITGGVTINHPFDGRDVERHLLRKQRSLAMGGAFA